MNGNARRADLEAQREELRTIPRGGLSANFWNYVERVSGRRSLGRFIWQGTVLTLMSRLPTIGASILRGLVYRAVLGGIGSSCLIEEDVRFHVPQRIFLGKRVFVGQYSYLDGQTSFLRLGDDVHLARFCTLRAGERGITVHDGVGLNMRTFLDGNGGVEIGANTLLSPGVQVISGNHIFDDPNVPIKLQGTAYGKVSIGEDCWLGTNVIVLPGVTIGRGAVIGGGAVVTRDIPEMGIALGIPAKVVGWRGPKGHSV
ncbi:MAG: acyltransferase [Chloroflexi bacterium]|nr:acyltransferase [Chloroflexota bacterium]